MPVQPMEDEHMRQVAMENEAPPVQQVYQDQENVRQVPTKEPALRRQPLGERVGLSQLPCESGSQAPCDLSKQGLRTADVDMEPPRDPACAGPAFVSALALFQRV